MPADHLLRSIDRFVNLSERRVAERLISRVAMAASGRSGHSFLNCRMARTGAEAAVPPGIQQDLPFIAKWVILVKWVSLVSPRVLRLCAGEFATVFRCLRCRPDRPPQNASPTL